MRQSLSTSSPSPAFVASGWAKSDDHLDHIHALARQLVRHLGESGARKTCQDNHWNGVLRLIDHLE